MTAHRFLPAALLLLGTVPAHAQHAPAPGQVSACFTPGPESCANVIASAVDAARATIRVQAYVFTSAPILHALVDAKHRGVDVEAILDRSQDQTESPRSRYTSATYLAHAGVRVWIDDAPAIAHNKVIIIDGRLVVTGSFNFTRAADTRNAENVVLIDSPEVAGWFTVNWESRKAASRSFETE